MPPKTYNSGGLPPDARQLVAGLLQQGDSICFTAFGPSMNPVIRSGESVRVRPVHANDLRPGSILLFKHHGRLVLHRVLRKRGEELWVRGDAGLGPPDKIREKQAIGIATVRYRGGRGRKLETRTARYLGIIWHKALFFRLFYAFLRFPRRPFNLT